MSDEEMEEHLRDAPWAYELHQGSRNAQTLRRRQLEDLYEPVQDRTVHQAWWAKHEGQEGWKFHQGFFPEENSPRLKRVIACVSPEAGFEEEDADQVYGTLCRSSRRRLQKALDKITVSELYSEPRITKEAAKEGMRQGSSIDLKTGYDLSKPADQRRAWRALQAEDPDLIMICPPCGPFSQMQAINYSRMSMQRAVALLGEGLHHLEFSMKVYEWQVRRGKIAIFEHPDRSKTWEEECVQRILRMPQVERVRGDLCEFGLKVSPSDRPSLKPTGFMVNSKYLARRLAKRCTGSHEHHALEGGTLTKQAEVYPPGLCKAIVKGLKEEVEEKELKHSWMGYWPAFNEVFEGDGEEEGSDLEDRLDEEVDCAGQHLPGRIVASPDDPDSDEEDQEEDESTPPRGGGVPRGVSEADKRKIKKLHANLGHPSTEDFVRALRMARAREEVWRYVKSEFRCDICESHQKPKLNRPATIPRSYAPGRTIGVDVVFFPVSDHKTPYPS
jgi:hypothetical protein